MSAASQSGPRLRPLRGICFSIAPDQQAIAVRMTGHSRVGYTVKVMHGLCTAKCWTHCLSRSTAVCAMWCRAEFLEVQGQHESICRHACDPCKDDLRTYRIDYPRRFQVRLRSTSKYRYRRGCKERQCRQTPGLGSCRSVQHHRTVARSGSQCR